MFQLNVCLELRVPGLCLCLPIVGVSFLGVVRGIVTCGAAGLASAPHRPQWDSQRRLQTLPEVPWEVDLLLLRDHS